MLRTPKLFYRLFLRSLFVGERSKMRQSDFLLPSHLYSGQRGRKCHCGALPTRFSAFRHSNRPEMHYEPTLTKPTLMVILANSPDVAKCWWKIAKISSDSTPTNARPTSFAHWRGGIRVFCHFTTSMSDNSARRT
jgi:hypothetical protein